MDGVRSVMLLLLLLVVLGVKSSVAKQCYTCAPCDGSSQTAQHCDDVCWKMDYEVAGSLHLY